MFSSPARVYVKWMMPRDFLGAAVADFHKDHPPDFEFFR